MANACSKMKTSSVRSDIIVAGGGLAGVCAAIIAARQGKLVSLVEKKSYLGGKVGADKRIPFEDFGSVPLIYQRDSGLINELWYYLYKFNSEGTYIGQAIAIHEWLKNEKRVKVFLDTELESVSFNKGRIRSIITVNRSLDFKTAFQGKCFLDCTGNGRLAKLSGVAGEQGVDRNELSDLQNINLPSGESFCSCLVCIVKGDREYSFECPSWVNLRWEDNHLGARVNFIKSLEKGFVGEHLVEWHGPSSTERVSPNELALCAWDFLKNRSPLRKIVKNFKLSFVSKDMCSSHAFRVSGDSKLSLNDLMNGDSFDDSVAVGRSSVRGNFSMISSTQELLPLTQPFEIPLGVMISKECKNLLLVGASGCATELTSRSLGEPSCSSQMGTASGLVAALSIEKNRMPRTLAKGGYIDEIRRRLNRINHTSSLRDVDDDDNLAISAKSNASSTLQDWAGSANIILKEVETRKCLFQFPVTSMLLERIDIWLTGSNEQELSIKLFDGAGYQNSTAGLCLHSENVKFKKSETCISVKPDLKLESRGWCYIEVESEQVFTVPLFRNGPVGYVFHDERSTGISNKRKYISEFKAVISDTTSVSASPKIRVSPPSLAYESCNVTTPDFRPNALPSLWISKQTDFQYPEYIELEWQEVQKITCIEISFDPSFEVAYPKKPTSMETVNFHSLVKDYRLYITTKDQKSKLLVDIKDNQLPFVSHRFEAIEIKALELEVLSTHGLDRAQIYQVRVYS